jgi:PAS domain S-box-containing protein
MQIFQDISSIILIIDPETGHILEANSAAAQYYGYSKTQLAGMSISALNVVPSKEIAREIEHCIEQDRHYVHFSQRLASGEIRQVELYLTPVHYQKRTVFICTIHDLEQQTINNQTALHSQRRLLSLLANQTDIVCRFNLDTTITLTNVGYQQLFGIPQSGERLLNRIPKQDQSAFLAYLTAFNTIQPIHTFTHRMLNQTGQPVWIEWTHYASFDKHNQIVEFQAIGHNITLRKQSEQALLKSEAQLRIVLNSLDALVYITDITTDRIIFINEYGRKQFGETIGQICWQALQYQQSNRCQFCAQTPLFDDMGQPAGIRRWEQQNTWNNRWYDCRDQAILWGDGRYVRLQIATDISKHILIEQDLRAERDLFSAGPVFTIVWAPTEHWPIRQVSSNIEMILGYTPKDMRRRDFRYLSLIHPDDQERIVQEVIHHITHHHNFFEQSYRLKTKTKGYRWFYDFTKLIRDGQQQLIEIRGYLFDQTRLKETEQALSHERHRLANIITSTNIGTWEWNIRTNEIIINDHWAEMIGYQLDELLPTTIHTWEQLVHPDDLKLCQNLLNMHFQGRSSHYNCELRMRHKAGHWIWIHDCGRVAEVNGSNQPVTMFGIHQDITDRKRSEQTLLETNAKLKEASAQAQLASVAKSEFLANMSHEIRTPMNGVIGMTGLLLETTLTSDQRRYAETIHKSAESLLTLLNDILDFSKIEAGRLELEQLDFNILELLNDIATTQAFAVDKKGLTFICAADPEMPIYLRGDPSRLRQILNNLISNAIKFTATGDIVVWLTTIINTPEQITLRASVRDTGIGIAPEKQNLLFNQFSQVDASTTRQYGGTGLGLAIARQLSELMGGQIGVTSQPHQGSEFWFTAQLQPHTSLSNTPPTKLPHLQGRRVLVIEPNQTEAEFITLFLKAWGLLPTCVTGGMAAEQCLEQAIIEQRPFSFMLCAAQLPDVDSLVFVTRILADAQLTNLCALLLAPLGYDFDINAYLDAGFVLCVTKPINYQTLRHHFDQLGKKCTVPNLTDENTSKQINTMPTFTGRVLIVEDNIINQQVIQGVLKNLGLHADVVNNGQEALQTLASIPYDLVLMDIQMPIMDGLEASRRIRAPDTAVLDATIPIIAMTARAMHGDREQCFAAGMTDYISKPLVVQEVLALLSQWLPSMSSHQQLRENTASSDHDHSSHTHNTVIPIFNDKALSDRIIEDHDVMCWLLNEFIRDMPHHIQGLNQALNDGDIQNVEYAAHLIHGVAANISGERLQHIAYTIEDYARACDLDQAQAQLALLHREYDLLVTTLQDWLATNQPNKRD